MDLVTDIFHAVLRAGLPLMALTFGVIWWAISRGRLGGRSVSELQESIKTLGKQREKKAEKDMEAMGLGTDDLGLDALGMDELDWDGQGGERKKKRRDKASPPGNADSTDAAQKLDPVLEKWFAFGGGFYGLVALYTWLIIEWKDVWNVLGDLPRIVFSFDVGSLISLAVNLFIESLMNFITAIAWPAYWLGEAGNPWVWIGVAYGGYWLGIKAARHAAERQRMPPGT